MDTLAINQQATNRLKTTQNHAVTNFKDYFPLKNQ